MEDNTSLFSLSVDPVTKSHLYDAAKWARFLAIVGFIGLVLMIVAGVFASVTLGRYEDMYSGELGARNRGMGGLMGATTAAVYIVVAIFWFFPLLFLIRFANNMQHALASNEQDRLNKSFQNLKVCFRYLGIITIIGFGFNGPWHCSISCRRGC